VEEPLLADSSSSDDKITNEESGPRPRLPMWAIVVALILWVAAFSKNPISQTIREYRRLCIIALSSTAGCEAVTILPVAYSPFRTAN
jgi:hypothetical protein